MRATFRDLLEAKRLKREEETGEAGFSLIELIVVVVIIGILVAIAIPVFLGIQHSARQAAAKAAATDGATAVSAVISDPAKLAADIDAALVANEKGNINLTDQSSDVGGDSKDRDVDKVCVEAQDTSDAAVDWFAGPGALADGSACAP